MGMFDYIRVEGHVLPGLDPNLFERKQDNNESLGQEPAVFQTKDLDNYLVPTSSRTVGSARGSTRGKRCPRRSASTTANPSGMRAAGSLVRITTGEQAR